MADDCFDCLTPVQFRTCVSQSYLDEQLAKAHCPVCACEHLHIHSVVVNLGHIEVTAGPGTSVSIRAASPGGRRGSFVWIKAHCEEGHAFCYSADFHKGELTIGLTATEVPEDADGMIADIPELWRD